MDRPNASMAQVVETSLKMDNKKDALAYLVEHRVPDRVIARLLSLATNPGQRRQAG
jgi:hypothetical protein